MKKDIIALSVTILLILGSFAASSVARMRHVEPEPEPVLLPHLSCILDIRASQDTTHALLTGYHYNILKKFAAANGKTMDIVLSNLDMSPIDSLIDGTADLLVVPWTDSLVIDSTLFSVPLDSSVVWVMRTDCEPEMIAANLWLDSYMGSPEDSVDRTRFFHQFGYRHTGYTDFLCPYDSLIRVQADSIGWDWRMLATIIYIESWFHIEAKSYRGAEGLLQLMPETAARFGSDDNLDPEKSIRAGARYLQKLARRYKDVGDNLSEWFKYTAAAYNAGEGRIDDCINYAIYRGRDPSYWINVEHVIPEMNDENIEATGVVRCGRFRGIETISYVEQVVRIYNRICELCPQ